MFIAYLGLGSNEGDRWAHLQAALQGVDAHDTLWVEDASPVYASAAHTVLPDEEQPPYLNAVLCVRGDCSPEALLRTAHTVERSEGRTRAAERRWQPRPLDIDLLVVGRMTCETETLTLPHPRLGDRRFVLRPWADLAPNFVVPPPFDRSVQALLDQCPDDAPLRRTDHRLDALIAEHSAPGGDSS